VAGDDPRLRRLYDEQQLRLSTCAEAKNHVSGFDRP
jgi:hypothetical protein